MRETLLDLRPFLEALHLKTGALLVLGGRMMLTVVALGVFFCLLFFGGLLMTRHPERIFQAQSFQANYADFNRAGLLLDSRQDPAWDGAIAGFGLGFELGRLMPIVGPIAGPLTIGILGYQLDRQV